MPNIFRFFAARPAFRYLALIAGILVVAGLSWIDYRMSDAPFYEANAPFWAYVIATPIWIVFAVLDRLRRP